MNRDVDGAQLAAIRAGDADAFAEMVGTHHVRLLAFVRRVASDRLLSRVEPEDLIQEAVASAIAALPEVASNDLDPLCWLFGLLRRRVIDAHRFHFAAERRNASKQRSLDAAFSPADDMGGGLGNLLASSMTTPSAALSRDLKIVRVRQAIDELEPDKRDIIRWRYVEGLPTKEIAERIGKTDAAVRVTLTRTVRKLEGLLGGE